MSDDPAKKVEALQRQIATVVHDHWKFLFAQGIVMIVLGLLAVLLPNVATLAVEILIGSLFLAGGLVRLFTLPRCRTAPGFWWSVVIAALSVALGVILLAMPVQGALTLTMVLVAFFIAEGILLIAAAFLAHRPHGNWGWPLLSGVVDLILAYLIWRGWPASAAWAIGLLVGINMFFLGLSLAMTAIAARTVADR